MLDKYEIRHVDALIIDVEGAELPVLRGLPWNQVTIGKIFCELHPYNWKEFGYGGDELSNFLKEHGYRCYDMYFHEWTEFKTESYIGPTIFLPFSQ